MTPEGRVKAKVKRLLKSYGDKVYAFWPVQTGMGARTLDCLICASGHFIAVETKAPGKAPTTQQRDTIATIFNAGGTTLVVDGDDGVEALKVLIDYNVTVHL